MSPLCMSSIPLWQSRQPALLCKASCGLNPQILRSRELCCGAAGGSWLVEIAGIPGAKASKTYTNEVTDREITLNALTLDAFISVSALLKCGDLSLNLTRISR